MFDIIYVMSIRKVELVSNEFYHIYNRGNGKNKIFLDKKDYDHFIKLLYICNSEIKFIFRDSIIKKKIDLWDFERGQSLVKIGAYCLMPNHFHILITSHRQDLWLGGVNPISLFMQKLSTAYAMYFNKKYNRTGGLFEGKFKSEHINNDDYLKYLFSYIHLNPVKLIQKDWKEKGIKNKRETLEYLNNYRYSSYLDFIGEKRIQNKIIDYKAFPNYFPTKEKFKKEIFEWLSFKSD